MTKPTKKELKIAFIQLRLMPLYGVDKKTEAQAEAIRNLNIRNFDFYILNPSTSKTTKNGVIFKKCTSKKSVFKYLDFIFGYNFWRYNFIKKSVELKKYDYIILRYPKADKSGISFFRKNNVITEHHGNEIVEFRLEIAKSKSLILKLAKLLRLSLEKKYGSKLLQNAKGFIGMSDTICNIELAKLSQKKPAIAISNGIDNQSVEFTKFKPYHKPKNFNIIFLASTAAPWHGLERIIDSLNNYSGDTKITLHIIGNFNQRFDCNAEIKYYGVLENDKLDEVMTKMHTAISTMALYYKKMNEASALKTREYIARGIPFIMAYNDTDLMAHPPEKKFFLQFPNDDSPIDFNKVIDFVKEINEKYQPGELSAYMRSYAEKYLDWKVKMKQYVDFVYEIDRNRSK